MMESRTAEPEVEGSAMEHLEKRFKDFRNQNTYWRHDQDGTLDRFHKEYEAAVERVRSELLGMDVPLVINGKEVETGSWLERTSPADTSLVVCRYPEATKEHAKQAIAVAHEAEKKWRETPWQDRAAALEKTASLFEKNFYDLCAIMTFESGKTRYEASIDVDEAIDFLRFYALTMREMDGFNQEMGQPVPNERVWSKMKPYGTFAIICPFNFPVAITTGMTAAALVTGNPAIMKPATKGILSGYRCFQLFIEGGVPDDVLQFVVGPDETVATELTENTDIKGICFTGSKHIGTKIMAKRIQEDPSSPLIVEMGGKNATIVTANADLDKAVEGCFRAAFGFQGQKCSASSRIIVDRRVKDEFVERLVARTEEAVVAEPWKKEAYMGPVIEESKFDWYMEWVEKARKAGRILTGGEAVKDTDSKGWYVRPTIVEGVPVSHEMFQTELFVPITNIYECDGIEEAVDLMNATQYGLTGGLMSEDPKEVEYFFENAECGVLYLNRKAGSSTAAVVNGQSFGGWKNSGHSGINAGGRWYLLQFMREQSQTRVSDTE